MGRFGAQEQLARPCPTHQGRPGRSQDGEREQRALIRWTSKCLRPFTECMDFVWYFCLRRFRY